MLSIIRRETYSLLIGNLRLFREMPLYCHYQGVFPRIRVVFTQERKAISKKLTLSKKGKQFTASLPASQLGIFEDLDTDESQAACQRLSETEFLFDFDPIPTEAFEVACELLQLCQDFPQLPGKIGFVITSIDA